jgi:hypothetical protein
MADISGPPEISWKEVLFAGAVPELESFFPDSVGVFAAGPEGAFATGVCWVFEASAWTIMADISGPPEISWKELLFDGVVPEFVSFPGSVGVFAAGSEGPFEGEVGWAFEGRGKA